MTTKHIPIIRWVGSKKRIIKHLINNIPDSFNNYYEPFLGSAIVFLNIPYEKQVFLNDINKDIINLYKSIQKYPDELIQLLEKYRKSYQNSTDKKSHFLKYRKKFNILKDTYNITRAALFVYINKTSFNGWMQTNKYGMNTSSFGDIKNPKLYKKIQIENLSKKLQKVQLKNTHYVKMLKNAKKQDFIYLDPPYVPEDFSNFNIKYNETEWTEDDFKELVKTYKLLDKKGCYVMLSNSNSKFIRKHFPKSKYRVIKIPIHRGLSPNTTLRSTKYELLIMNY